MIFCEVCQSLNPNIKNRIKYGGWNKTERYHKRETGTGSAKGKRCKIRISSGNVCSSIRNPTSNRSGVALTYESRIE